MAGKNYKAIRSLAILLLLASCKPDKPVSPNNVPPVDSNAKSVYIVCEGNFGNGNSALSLYRPETGGVYEDVFKTANNQDLGDVFQSMTRIGNRLFLCVNNSDEIVVVNRDNWQIAGNISVSKPRYIVAVSDTKAYVSSLYTNKITIINPQTLEVTGTITMPGNNPEGMLLHKGKVFVALWDTAVSKLYAINPANDQVLPFEDLMGSAPKEIVADKDGMLWILGGNIQKNKSASQTKIDPVNGGMVSGYPFPADRDPLRLTINFAGDQLYFLLVNYTGGTEDNGVYRMGINATNLPTQAFIPAQNLQYFWALGIDRYTGNIYVGDPKGFTQTGTVYIYSVDGQQLKTFNCGVGPGHFYFNQ